MSEAVDLAFNLGMDKINIFQVVKESVSAREVAEYYGMTINRNSMTVCPFHMDKNPSMKVDSRFYCFGCQASGDAIDLVSKLFDIGKKDAALRIASDFGISSVQEISEETQRKIQKKQEEARQRRLLSEKRNHFWHVITDYYYLLKKWEEELSPHNPGDDWNPLYVEALQKKPNLEYIMDAYLESSEEEQNEIAKSYERKLKEYEQRISKFK